MKLNSFARVRSYIPPFDAGRLAIYACGMISAIIVPLLLVSFAMLTELLVTGGEVERGTWLSILFQVWPAIRSDGRCLAVLLGSFVALAMIEALAAYALNFAVQLLAARTATRLRGELRRQLFHLGGSQLFGVREVNPVQLFTDNVETVRSGLVTWWRTVPREFFRLSLLVALAMALHVWLALTAILLAWLVWRLLSALESRRSQRQKILADRAAHLMAMLVEGLQQVRLVRGYLLDDTPGQPFDETLLRYHKAAEARDEVGSARGPLAYVVLLLAAVLLFGLAGLNVLRQPPRIAVDEAVALFAALAYAWLPLSRIQRLPESLKLADRAAAEAFNYLDREPSVAQTPNAELLDPPAEQLELVEVTLQDGAGHKLLDEVSLQIPVGGKAAIVTLDEHLPHAMAGLWPRFYDPQHGSVLFDQKDARYCTLNSLRSHLGLVLKEGLLFTGSVAENISCGDPAFTEQQIYDAAKSAQAYDFIQRLPLGFATTVGEHGMHLSASQQFRLGLARALLREPSILVVEEPDEDPDPAAEDSLDLAMAESSHRRTLIVFPSRMNTLRTVDRVYLVHEGKLHAEGSHAELLQASDLYRHLLYMRYNAFRDGKH